MSQIGDLTDAMERGDIPGALLAGLELAAMPCLVYLGLLLTIAVLTRFRPSFAGTLRERLPGLRFTTLLLGIGVAAGVSPAGIAGAQEAPTTPPTTPPSELPVLQLLEDDPPTMRVITSEPPATTTTSTTSPPVTTPAPPPTPALAGTPPADAPVDSPTDRWRIEPGDHLWHVAEQTLRDAWDRPPSEGETAGYWRALLDANRERLVDPHDPDLVFPGQEMDLPPIPPA